MQKPKRVSQKYLEGAPKYVAAIYDNGGKSNDRYTVIYTAPLWTPAYTEHWLKLAPAGWGNPRFLPARAMSENPFHPQGIGLFVDALRGSHLGKLVSWHDLPNDCKRCVIQDGQEDS